MHSAAYSAASLHVQGGSHEVDQRRTQRTSSAGDCVFQSPGFWFSGRAGIGPARLKWSAGAAISAAYDAAWARATVGASEYTAGPGAAGAGGWGGYHGA